MASKQGRRIGAGAPRGTFMRMTADLHRRAMLYSYDNKMTLKALVEAALDEYLKKRGA